MRILRNLAQVILTSLSLCISVASAQTPCDSLDIVDPIENPQNIDQTQDNTLPSESDIFISDKLIIPVDPYIPPVPVEPLIPLEPIIPSGDKLVIDIDPTDPGIPTNNNKYTLGSVSGTLTVNGLGAAEFAVPIEAPVAGPLIPNLSLVYNSQNATNGLAGYGITLSGLSSITRGEKSIFNNNGSIAGITYTNTDNLFLDGKRLILESGTHCLEGAVYCIEGDPFTKITAHTQNTLGIADTWFEIKTPDGLTFQYGKTSDSKLIFNNASGNRRIASWHINRTEDVKGNYMTVKYKQVDYYLYPESVLYGMNSIKDRGLKNKIEINYEDIGATPNYFFLEDKKGSINKRIASITSSSNDEVFRKYILSYDVTSDKSTFPYARLISIQEKNGYGDSLTPTKISWSSLTDGSIAVARIKDPTLNINDMITLDDSKKAYMAADVTGDGISDIIVIATGKKKIYTKYTLHTFVIICTSKLDDRNKVTYNEPLIYEFPYNNSTVKCGIFDVNTIMGGFHLSDIDGDGINDMILPQRMYVGDSWNTENLYIILGKDIKNEKKVNYKAVNPINPTTSSPLYASCDFDGDGKDEILCIETNSVDGFYRASTVKFDESKESIDSKSCNFEISGKPEKVFCGDYNNDGLNDIIVLHKNGYKIFYNLGGTETNVLFDTSISKAGTTMKDQIRIDQGDFNGDGLLDFVYNVNGESVIRVAYNNGNGTFNTVASYDVNISPRIIDEKEDHFFLRAVDMDRDGSSEVLVCKAVYDIKSSKKVFKETQVRWLKLDGLKLKLNKSFTKTSEADADEKLIFIGDFDGDGYIDLANVGSALDRQDATVYNKTINIYHTNGANASLGRVTSITDGLGNTSTVKYSYLTSPDVYSLQHHMDTDLRVNTLTLPLPVVKQLNFSNGIVNGPNSAGHRLNP